MVWYCCSDSNGLVQTNFISQQVVSYYLTVLCIIIIALSYDVIVINPSIRPEPIRNTARITVFLKRSGWKKDCFNWLLSLLKYVINFKKKKTIVQKPVLLWGF